jgi:hypothetical protein
MGAIHGNGIVKYKCSSCGQNGDIPMSNLSFEDVDMHGREMGPETHHRAQWDFNCPKCDAEIKLSFDVWEYPEGQINYKDCSADGAEILSRFGDDGFDVILV